MFNAYSISSIATKLPLELDAITSDDRALYGGTKNGSLVSYSYSLEQSNYSLYVCRNFMPKTVSQLTVVKEFKLIVSLVDGIISIHDLTVVNYPVVSTLKQIKGVSFFDIKIWKKDVCNNVKGPTLFLAVVSRRKINVFYWENMEFFEYTELPETVYPDNIRCASWCPGGKIGLTVRDEYFLLKVFPSNRDGDELPGNNRYLFTTGNKSLVPVIKSLFNLNVIAFCHDEETYFVTTDGRMAENLGYSRIRWSHVPQALEYDFPFLLALLPDCVEIRSIKPTQLVQTIDLQKPQLISWGARGCLHVACFPASNLVNLYCLFFGATSLRSSVQQLVNDKEYELACQLAENIQDDKNQDEKQRRLNEIKNLYAFHLFSQRRFKEAMQIFGEIDAEVLYVIGLFPDLLPEEVRKRVTYPGSLPTDLAKNETVQSLQALAEYLSMVRTNIAKHLDAYKKRKFQNVASSDSSNDSLDRNHILNEMTEVQQKNLLQIVDTTLLKCYLQTNDMLVASLIRLPDNRCDVAECEKMLLDVGKFNELFLLYERKGLHDSALKLLQRQAKNKDSPLKGLTRSLHYMQNLGNNHLSLILTYATWIFKENPDEALKIFTEDCDEVRSLDRKKVLEFLLKESPISVIPYLEHLLTKFNESRVEFTDALIRHCFNDVKSTLVDYINTLKDQPMPPAGLEPGTLGAMRSKLLNYIELSSRFNAEILLNELPENLMHEERAVLLGRAGRHSQALTVYSSVLYDFKRAEAYCVKYHSQKIGASSENLFVLMLSSYVKPENVNIPGCMVVKKAPNVRLAMKVLKDYAAYFDLSQAIQLLPLDVKLEELWIALEAVFHGLARKKSNAQMRASLLHSIVLQTQQERLISHRTKVQIGYGSSCSICSKKIGSSAFSRLVNGNLAHYYCLQR